MTALGRIFRVNIIPGLVLSTATGALVLSYYLWSDLRPVWSAVAQAKRDGGFLASAVVAGCAGGVLPLLLQRAMGRLPPTMGWLGALATILFWSWKGIEADLYYAQVLGRWFGTGTDIGTILAKSVVDQLIWVPVYGMLSAVLFTTWAAAGCSFAAVGAQLGSLRQWYLTSLVATWMLWVPCSALIFCMPADLQLPLWNITLCFYCLLLPWLGDQKAT